VSVMTEKTKEEALQEIGKSVAESIAEMVAALECDYDRLEELRDTLKDCDTDLENGDCKYTTAEMDDMRVEKAAGDCESREDAERRIQEDPLSLEVRGGWHSPGDENTEAEEFCLLLGTGGPAVRIIGDLGNCSEPSRATLQTQDWFTPWTDYTGDAISQRDLLTYCRVFNFGE